MNMLLREMFNNNIDKLVRPEVHILHKPWPAFQVYGCIGLALAILLAMVLVIYQGLSPWIMLIIVLVALFTFFAQVIITKILIGEEDIVYYRHEIAVIAIAALFLWIVRQPILPYLDATLLGVGMFAACGRIGCLMVGCCHGRPHKWGVCYGEKHAAAGFPSCYVGVRLFPSQILESFAMLSIVLVGSALIISRHPAGTSLTWYVVSYDAWRFYNEFMRGDAERLYFRGFSEAQWCSLLLMCAVVLAELSGVLAFYPWHIVATACLVCTMIAVALDRRLRRTISHQLLHPYHVKEVADVLERVSTVSAKNIAVDRTSLGIQLSVGKMESETGYVCHYALSQQQGDMTEEIAGCIAKLILQLKHPINSSKPVQGQQGIFHLLIDASQESEPPVHQARLSRVGIEVV